MRYSKLIFFLTLAFLLMTGTGTKEVKLTEGIQKGNLAPKINLQDVKFENKKWILVQFWAAYNGQSHVLNVQMHNAITRLKTDSIQLISISFDEKKAIFEGVIKVDQLNPATQFNEPKGKNSEIFKTYRLKSGFSNWLIDPEGVIIAKNLSPNEITRYINW
jgi:hypothetical protein